jgi:hypothetical protein
MPAPAPVVTTRENLDQIPYLGPLPLPARPFVRPLQVVVVLLALLGVARAILLGQRSGIDGQLATTGRTRALVDQVLANERLLSGQRSAVLALSAVFLVLVVLWRSRRRPRRVVRDRGEAYVEASDKAIVPLGLRLATVALWVSGGLLGGGFAAPRRPALDQLAGLRLQAAAGSVLWAIGMLLYLAWIGRTTAAIDRRVSWSAPHRAAAADVPHYTPLGGWAAAFDAGRGADTDDVGDAEGAGWILGTTGLALAALVAIVVLVASVGSGRDGVPWMLGSAFVVVLAGRELRRRQQDRALRRAAGSLAAGH